jgi:Hint domain
MYLNGVLIEAQDLLNGTSIVQPERAETVEYIHVELDSHDVIFAEGALSESFIDDGSRGLFHNADDYRKLYGDALDAAPRYCAPRPNSGYEVEAARHRIEQRAGLHPASAEHGAALRGSVDQIDPRSIRGWAQNPEHREAAVCLDIYMAGRLIGQTLANRYRGDLVRAGLGSGCHGFDFKPPAGLAFSSDAVEVRRSSDGQRLGPLWRPDWRGAA